MFVFEWLVWCSSNRLDFNFIGFDALSLSLYQLTAVKGHFSILWVGFWVLRRYWSVWVVVGSLFICFQLFFTIAKILLIYAHHSTCSFLKLHAIRKYYMMWSTKLIFVTWGFLLFSVSEIHLGFKVTVKRPLWYATISSLSCCCNTVVSADSTNWRKALLKKGFNGDVGRE